jgi:hypothetical protein
MQLAPARDAELLACTCCSHPCLTSARPPPPAPRAPGSNGTDWDYCQVNTASGCRCSNNWAYGGASYSGVCRLGTLAGQPASPLIPSTASWCYVDKCSASTPQYNGYAFDFCAPPVGRTTVSGKACVFNVRCAVPAAGCLRSSAVLSS